MTLQISSILRGTVRKKNYYWAGLNQDGILDRYSTALAIHIQLSLPKSLEVALRNLDLLRREAQGMMKID